MICSAISLRVLSQCTPAAMYATSPWATPSDPATPYAGYLCQTEDSIISRIGWSYFDGDGYSFFLFAGSDVTISTYDCGTSPASLTVLDATAGIGSGTFIAGGFVAAACPNSVNFIAPYTGKYTVVFDVNDTCSDAGADSVGRASIKLNNAASYPSCIPPAVITNDSICGAEVLTLNNDVFADNTNAVPSDADDATAASLGYACYTLNNTLWYSFTPASSDSFEVYFASDPAGNAMAGWFGVLSTPTIVNPCTSTLTYEGCYYGPFNATLVGATGNGSVGPPYDGVVPTADSTINHIYMNANTTYYFFIDGVAGAVGEFSFGVRTLLVGINESASLNNLISLNPNPSNGIVQLKNNSGIKDLMLTVYNSVGQNVYTSSLSNVTSEKVDLSFLPKGIYTVKMNGENTELTKKLVLN
jgi:hypothetical protein